MVAHVQGAGVTLGGKRKSVAGAALETLSKETALRLLCWEGKSQYINLGADETDNMSQLGVFAYVKASLPYA